MSKLKEFIMHKLGLCELDALIAAHLDAANAQVELDRFKREDYKKCMELMREKREQKEHEARKAEKYRLELERKTAEVDALRYEVEKLQADLLSTEQFYRKQGVTLEAVKKVKRVKKGGKV